MPQPSFGKKQKGPLPSLIVGFVLSCLALFAVWHLINPQGAAWERAWVLGFHTSMPAGALPVLQFITVVGYPVEIIVTAAAFALWWLVRGSAWKTALLIADTLLLSIVDYSAKPYFHRARPELFSHAHLSSAAYPSGHALFLLGFYGVIAYLIAVSAPGGWRTLVWALWVVFALVIGYSRIALGLHWPTDVLAGYLSGAIMLVATAAARRRAYPSVGRRRRARRRR